MLTGTAIFLAVGGLAAEHSSLAGEWHFALDERGEGTQHEWYNRALPDTITLPGTTDEARKGQCNTNAEVMRLSRPFGYQGSACYQRELVIPESWRDKRVVLLLERTKHTTVWVDDQHFGEQDSLAASHVYDIGAALSPGAHRLTILVDNRKQPPVSGHQLSEDTQTDWNGIIGRIELVATDKIWLDDVQVFPDAANRQIRVCLAIGNLTGELASGAITLLAGNGPNSRPIRLIPVHCKFAGGRHGSVVEIEYHLGSQVELWDEFAPALYQLTASLNATAGTNRCSDQCEVSFGLRDFSTHGTQFAINGRTTFLRGKHDACVFPLTG